MFTRKVVEFWRKKKQCTQCSNWVKYDIVILSVGEYSCVESGSLKKHIRIHNEEKPFK